MHDTKRPLPYLRHHLQLMIALAGFSHGWGVNAGQDFFCVVYQQLKIYAGIEELKIAQKEVLLDGPRHGTQAQQGMPFDSVSCKDKSLASASASATSRRSPELA